MFSGNSSVPSLHSIAPGTEEFLEKLLSVDPSESSLEAVVLVMESSLRYFTHLFEDFIPGSKYSGAVEDVVIDRTRCASATNRFIECGFGFVDRLFTHSPNMSISRREACLLISKNHTMAWLSSKSPEERQAIVSIARASISTNRAEETLAKKLLSEAILQKGLEKEKEYVAKCDLRIKRRNQAIASYAIMDSPSESVRVSALSAQIRFRERALQQPPPEPKIYTLRKKGKKLTEEELHRRLAVLIEADQKGTLLTLSTDHPFTGRSIRRWSPEANEDGISSVKRRGETSLVTLSFPSGSVSYPLPQLETLLDEGPL